MSSHCIYYIKFRLCAWTQLMLILSNDIFLPRSPEVLYECITYLSLLLYGLVSSSLLRKKSIRFSLSKTYGYCYFYSLRISAYRLRCYYIFLCRLLYSSRQYMFYAYLSKTKRVRRVFKIHYWFCVQSCVRIPISEYDLVILLYNV